MNPDGTSTSDPVGIAPAPDGDADGTGRIVLDVRHLSVSYRVGRGYLDAVDDVSFTVREGEYFGLVGESGCGKSTLAKAILRLLPDDARVAGEALLNGSDVLVMDERTLATRRWREMSVITQSSMNALDPVFRLEDQFHEALRIHDRTVTREAARARAWELFELVGIPPSRLRDYPHQLSGGMKQRVVIAVALALNPDLIIADEPTTALDVILQDQIMGRIERIHKQLRKSMILITHDMALVAENCERGVVMYAGQVAEYGRISTLLKRPFHPYAMGLKNAFPDLRGAGKDMISISGVPPFLNVPIPGCRFADRCPFHTEACLRVPPPLSEVEPGHFARCHYPERAEEFRARAVHRSTWESAVPVGAGP